MQVLDKETLRHQLVTERNINKQLRHELKQFEWVSVDDRLPDTDGEFIVLVYGDVTTKEFNPWASGGDGEQSYQWFEWQDVPNYGSEKCNVLGVTHWMPLPPTP